MTSSSSSSQTPLLRQLSTTPTISTSTTFRINLNNLPPLTRQQNQTFQTISLPEPLHSPPNNNNDNDNSTPSSSTTPSSLQQLSSSIITISPSYIIHISNTNPNDCLIHYRTTTTTSQPTTTTTIKHIHPIHHLSIPPSSSSSAQHHHPHHLYVTTTTQFVIYQLSHDDITGVISHEIIMTISPSPPYHPLVGTLIHPIKPMYLFVTTFDSTNDNVILIYNQNCKTGRLITSHFIIDIRWIPSSDDILTLEQNGTVSQWNNRGDLLQRRVVSDLSDDDACRLLAAGIILPKSQQIITVVSSREMILSHFDKRRQQRLIWDDLEFDDDLKMYMIENENVAYIIIILQSACRFLMISMTRDTTTTHDVSFHRVVSWKTTEPSTSFTTRFNHDTKDMEWYSLGPHTIEGGVISLSSMIRLENSSSLEDTTRVVPVAPPVRNEDSLSLMSVALSKEEEYYEYQSSDEDDDGGGGACVAECMVGPCQSSTLRQLSLLERFFNQNII